MDNKINELKAAAMAATPGPWRALSFDERLGIDGDGGAILVCEHITKQRPQDALFIVAANPAVILALLAEMEASVLVPGVLRCAKCNFQLVKKILCMKAGTVGSGDNKTEPCPNGCGPLWPVTWQQWATEMDEQAGRYFDELKAAEAKLAQHTVRLAGFELEGGEDVPASN